MQLGLIGGREKGATIRQTAFHTIAPAGVWSLIPEVDRMVISRRVHCDECHVPGEFAFSSPLVSSAPFALEPSHLLRDSSSDRAGAAHSGIQPLLGEGMSYRPPKESLLVG